ncbi:hypothetical protein CkaCkLH20_06675 [Colletotrichum karsti]|uniref:Uncharacterized protein n=1 Tax=Colletotrichum karsti TaxID=1095194 RepID=A0A9P6LJJ5_9PEZI|nr:uncharacterized protein CkaCkLH20_06675 [Colletotrichum karsti]KAF9875743.1 hypothetical protein CkaCkLH20_06675 [Colletotrichum karsti]
MEAININWHETFSFFISDIEYYHQVSTERLGVIVQSVLKHHEPSEVTDSPPLPWCSLLRDLMKVLRCQLGCNILPDNDTNYPWLDMPYIQQSKPYVDWLLLEVETTDSPEEIIDDLVSFLGTKAYGPIESRPTWTIKPCQAWCSNPFLVDFQNAYGMQPWSVPIPFVKSGDGPEGNIHVAGMSQETKQATHFAQTFPHRQVAWSSVRFMVTPEHVALTFDHGEPSLSREGINGLKCLYTALLRWMKSRLRDKSEPLSKFVTAALKQWIFEKNDTMNTNNKLWFELRTFQDSCNSCSIF